jgi:hypothetical protein
MTSLGMAGVSVTLLPIDALSFDALSLLDAVTDAPAWPRTPAGAYVQSKADLSAKMSPEATAADTVTDVPCWPDRQRVLECVVAMAKTLQHACDRLNKLDSLVGLCFCASGQLACCFHTEKPHSQAMVTAGQH